MLIFQKKFIFLAFIACVFSLPSAALQKIVYIAQEKFPHEMISFCDALKKDTVCEDLSFNQWTLNGENISVFFDALKINQSVTYLDISNNGLSNEIAKFAETLKHNTALENLRLRETYMTPDELFLLAEAMEINNSIKWLNLSKNPLGSDAQYEPGAKKAGITRLAEALKNNKSLKYLGLYDCLLNKEDAQILGTALKENKNLKALDVSENLLGEEGIISILNAAQKNNSLQLINFDIYIREKNIAAISRAIHNLLQVNNIIVLEIGTMNLTGKEYHDQENLKKLLQTIEKKYSHRVK